MSGLFQSITIKILALTSALASSVGAGMIGVDLAAIPSAINTADWALKTDSNNGFNILRLIAPADWAGVLSGGSAPAYDVTTRLQTALNGNQVVFMPAGGYVSDRVTLNDNNTLQGNGWSTVLKQKSAAFIDPPGWTAMLVAVSGSRATFKENITIRNMQLLGNVVTDGFIETTHLISLEGARNVLITGCLFKGWQGDAIICGFESFTGVSADCRQARDVLITNNVFDGVNNNNRQGVSGVFFDGLTISNNVFKNCTRNDMPGAVDFEASRSVTTIMNGVVTGNTFNNVGGSAGCVSITNRGSPTSQNFIVSNNVASNANLAQSRFIYIGGTTAAPAVPINIVVIGNRASLPVPFKIQGQVIGVSITTNNFTHQTPGLIGGDTTTTNKVEDVIISNNVFNGGLIGTKSTGAFVLWSADGVQVKNNTFNGYEVFGIGLGDASEISGYSVVNANISDNTFKNITAPFYAVTQNTPSQDKGASNVFRNNILSGVGVMTHIFQAWRNDDCGDVTNNDAATTFNMSTLPDSFPAGISTAILDGNTTGYPAGLGTSYGKGTLITYAASNTLQRTGMRQELYHLSDGFKIGSYFFRQRSSGANTWDAWVELVP